MDLSHPVYPFAVVSANNLEELSISFMLVKNPARCRPNEEVSLWY